MNKSDPSHSRSEPAGGESDSRWTECLGEAGGRQSVARRDRILAGVFTGEGIGAEVIGGAVKVLVSVAEAAGLDLELRYGGPIGRDGERESGSPLPRAAIDFCSEVFAESGAVLCGPGGGRFVYDIRKVFDLFFKISPLRTANGLADAARIREPFLEGVDILLVRENSGGIYQGEWGETGGSSAGKLEAFHRFGYSGEQVRRFLGAAVRLAKSRSGRLTVVWKESGIPSVSRLWRRCLEELTEGEGVAVSLVDVDLMAYRLIQEASAFDVVAAPNLFGDVLGDLGAVLLGSRGISYSGNYSAKGRAVYQTNHGAAYDLAGLDQANPVGQILSVAMMLRESFGRGREADAIQEAVRSAWNQGCRTIDVAVPGSRVVGTSEMADRIATAAAGMLRDRTAPLT